MNYHERFSNVLAFIDSNLEGDLSLDNLCKISLLSKFHFHRLFSAQYKISLSAYIKQLRMKRASYQLAFRLERKVIDIALQAGFESSEAFSRAFKKSIGQSPSEFRRSPDWQPWHEKHQLINQLRDQKMPSQPRNYSVDIVEFKQIKIAVLEHRGAPNLIGNSIRKFIEWRKKNKLPPSISRTFNLVYDDPNLTQAEDYRFDIGASIKSDVSDSEFGIITKIIPEGRCAVIRHLGADNNIEQPINYLYGEWLSQSDNELRDFPLFFERVSFYPDVPENEMIIDIYLPLK